MRISSSEADPDGVPRGGLRPLAHLRQRRPHGRLKPTGSAGDASGSSPASPASSDEPTNGGDERSLLRHRSIRPISTDAPRSPFGPSRPSRLWSQPSVADIYSGSSGDDDGSQGPMGTVPPTEQRENVRPRPPSLPGPAGPPPSGLPSLNRAGQRRRSMQRSELDAPSAGLISLPTDMPDSSSLFNDAPGTTSSWPPSSSPPVRTPVSDGGQQPARDDTFGNVAPPEPSPRDGPSFYLINSSDGDHGQTQHPARDDSSDASSEAYAPAASHDGFYSPGPLTSPGPNHDAGPSGSARRRAHRRRHRALEPPTGRRRHGKEPMDSEGEYDEGSTWPYTPRDFSSPSPSYNRPPAPGLSVSPRPRRSMSPPVSSDEVSSCKPICSPTSQNTCTRPVYVCVREGRGDLCNLIKQCCQGFVVGLLGH